MVRKRVRTRDDFYTIIIIKEIQSAKIHFFSLDDKKNGVDAVACCRD